MKIISLKSNDVKFSNIISICLFYIRVHKICSIIVKVDIKLKNFKSGNHSENLVFDMLIHFIIIYPHYVV